MEKKKVGRKKLSEDKKYDFPVSIRLNKWLKINLEAYCKVTGITKSEVVQKALEDYLNENLEKIKKC